MDSSFSLIRRAKAGDQRALSQLIGRHLKPLRRWAHGRLPRWAREGLDTEDLVQESVARSLGNLASFTPRRQGAIQAYLRQAIMNRIRDEIRRVTSRGPVGALDENATDRGPSPMEEVLGRDLALRYEHALAALSDDDRALIVARVELGYTHEQIAMALGKPTSDAARMSVARALARLATGMHLPGR